MAQSSSPLTPQQESSILYSTAPAPSPFSGYPAGPTLTLPPGVSVPGRGGTPSPMPTTPLPPPYSSPGGQIQGTEGFTYPQPRTLAIVIQKLAGSTDFYAVSKLIPFPFYLRGFTVHAPNTTITTASDGQVSISVGPDPTASAVGLAAAVNVWGLFSTGNLLYCPVPISVSGLWQPFPDGHNYILTHTVSTGGATNLQSLCVVYITPFADVEGV